MNETCKSSYLTGPADLSLRTILLPLCNQTTSGGGLPVALTKNFTKAGGSRKPCCTSLRMLIFGAESFSGGSDVGGSVGGGATGAGVTGSATTGGSWGIQSEDCSGLLPDE